jgi:predicted enzyme related to lactoylglutathione lyase
MDPLRVSAVLFAKDHAKLSAFYRDTLSLRLTKAREDHTILSAGGFDLVVHQIPKHIAGSITIEQPPQRRERAAIKLSFPVQDIAAVRAIAGPLGGALDPPSAEWRDGDVTTCKGHDPEGNVFQVSALVSGARA